MAGIHRYFKPIASLPRPSETKIGERATTEANTAVQNVLEKQRTGKRKRKAYTTFGDEQRAKIGRYAAENGTAATLRKFKSDVPDLGESTVRLFKRKYLDALKKCAVDAEVTTLPSKKRGKPLALGQLDEEVQKYVRALRKAGTAVNTAVILAAAEGIVTSRDRTLLAQNGGGLNLTKSWAASLLQRMGWVKRRGSTAKRTNMSEEEFKAVQQRFLGTLAQMATDKQVPPQLIINWDQTGLNVVPSSSWTMEEEGSKRVEIAGLNDKRQITATFAVAMTGDILPFQILYAGKTHRCHPSYPFPPQFDIWHTPNHWANTDTTLRLITNVVVPYINAVRERMELDDSHPAIAIYDAFRGHQSQEVTQLLTDNNILTVQVPPNCTDRLQPLDVSVNKAVKENLRKSFNVWYAEQVQQQLAEGTIIDDVKVDMRMSVMKELEAKWIVSCYDYLQNNKLIVYNGFKEAGIVDALQNPPTTQTIDDGDPFEGLSDED